MAEAVAVARPLLEGSDGGMQDCEKMLPVRFRRSIHASDTKSPAKTKALPWCNMLPYLVHKHVQESLVHEQVLCNMLSSLEGCCCDV